MILKVYVSISLDESSALQKRIKNGNYMYNRLVMNKRIDISVKSNLSVRIALEINNINTHVNQYTDYYPFGMPYASSEYPERQPYKFGGKELDEMHGLNWYDFHARQLSTTIPRFTTQDPLAEKYYSVSPYAYCLNNPVKYVDTDGRIPRIYVEIKGVGHTFITTGEGKNTTVYTYGRYGGIDKGKSSSGSLSRTGEGVLIVMKGEDALNYIKHEYKDKGASIYEVTNGSDEKIDAHFSDMFNSSDKKPSGEGKYANADNARVVDTYDFIR
jgi:RHS repeat-associated protein